MRTIRSLTLFAAALGVLLPSPLFATHPCTSPLVLDLDGDGRILTTGPEHPVEFDINGDGVLDTIGWTSFDPTEGFLWLDLNRNHTVDNGSELFGSSTRLPEGGFASNGFEALAVYDRQELGGDGDGLLSPQDFIWRDLRIWVDANHNGISETREIRPLRAHGISAIDLEYEEFDRLDGNVNLHAQRGSFVQRTAVLGEPHLRRNVIEDIFFVPLDAERVGHQTDR